MSMIHHLSLYPNVTCRLALLFFSLFGNIFLDPTLSSSIFSAIYFLILLSITQMSEIIFQFSSILVIFFQLLDSSEAFTKDLSLSFILNNCLLFLLMECFKRNMPNIPETFIIFILLMM